MAEQSMNPVLQKPPGYRDQTTGMPPAGIRQPPRKPVIPPSFRPKKRRRSFCRFCCCCLCLTLFLLIFLLLLATAVFYLWFDPKLPGFRLASFRVAQFQVSDDPAGASLSAKTVARVEMKNPNSKLVLYYGDTDVEVSIGQGSDETGVGSTKVGGFKQRPKNTTSLSAETSVKNQLLDDRVAKRLAGKFKSKDLVVSVAAKSKVGLGVGGIKIGMLGVNLRCGGVTLNTLDSDSPKCNLNTLKW